MAINRYNLEKAGNYGSRFSKQDRKILEAAQANREVYDTFQQAIVASNFDNADGTIYTGATAEVLGFTSGKHQYEVYLANIASAAVLAPYTNANGLILQAVCGAADNIELTLGKTSLSKAAYTVGTDRRFYCQLKIKIPDISGITELWFGWRKAEAYQADPDDYDEEAGFLIGSGATGRINIATILNNAATSITNTTNTAMVDNDTITLRVEVDANGNCDFFVNDAAPTVTKAFKFDSDEVVIPFLAIDGHADGADVEIKHIRVGAMSNYSVAAE